MTMTNKDTEIILCSGIKMDRNYENVLSYTEEQMVTLCRNNQIYNGLKYAIIQPNKTIDVAGRYEDCIYANYMAFINPKYGNKWFFAWITNVELRNPNTTRITFQVDVFSTWYNRFNIQEAFIEREHVSDDTIGKHTIPEGLETGEYTIKDELDSADLIDVCPVVCATVTPDLDNVFSSYSGNRYEALGYFIFKGALMTTYDGGDQADAIDAFINKLNENDKIDAIVSIFMAPKKLVGWTGDGTWNLIGGLSAYSWRNALDVFDHTTPPVYTDYDKPIYFSDLTKSMPTTFGSYSPKNNKMYVFPYSYINLTNNNGGNGIYRYEDFSTTPTFELSGTIAPSCSIRAVPKNYKGQTKAYNDGLQGAKYPICSWINDIYTNWLTQQAVNIGLDTAKNIGSIIGGVATGTVAPALGGLMGIANTLASVYQHSLIPPQAEGNLNGGDVGASNKKITFTLQTIQIREEMARVIDSYFSRFGYKVNEVKTPNLTSRSKFNFIKVGGLDELVSGNIPAVDLEEINRVFRKGVTIFHNYNDIGNYTISNPIVTP